MSLFKKINELRVQIDDLQSQLETAEAKIVKRNLKRSRKQFRKRMAKDPIFRAQMRLISGIANDMYRPSKYCIPYAGIMAQCL